MKRIIPIALLLVSFFSCKKKNDLYASDFSNLNGWTTETIYDNLTNDDTAWAYVDNNQLIIGASANGPEVLSNYANAKYDFSHWDIDFSGKYEFTIGIVSPGVWQSVEGTAVGIDIWFDHWLFRCEGYKGFNMTNDGIVIVFDLSDHTFIVTRESDSEDLTDNFVFNEYANEGPFRTIEFSVGGTYQSTTQTFSSVQAKFDKLVVRKCK